MTLQKPSEKGRTDKDEKYGKLFDKTIPAK